MTDETLQDYLRQQEAELSASPGVRVATLNGLEKIIEDRPDKRYLGIPTASMPLLVFFDNLDAPYDRVEWSLQDRSGRDVVRDLRDLLKIVSNECGWDLHQRQG
jgi:hypothetical protein